MEFERIGAKLFCEGPPALALADYIPIFHRWLQSQTLPGTAIDVADYSHVPSGPGIVLVSHEGNLAVDETGGRRGLFYYNKRGAGGAVGEILRSVVAHLAQSALRLQAEPELSGRESFSAAAIEIVSNDRLAAPNTAEGRALLEPAVKDLAARLYGEGAFELSRGSEDPRERLSLLVKAEAAAASLEGLATRAAA